MMGMFAGPSGQNTVTGASLRDSTGQINSGGSALTGDQLKFMMQREKFNNSALIQTTTNSRQMGVDAEFQSLPNNSAINAPSQVNLNKVYGKKTPTSG